MVNDMRLIDADELTKDLTQLAKHQCGEKQSTIIGVVYTISKRKTIDPVKHGKWTIEDLTPGTMRVTCSECRISRWLERGRFYKYCPFCGARMNVE